MIGSNIVPNIGGLPASGSQQSSLFPWDNAGASSSAGGAAAADPYGEGSDRISLEIKFRGRGSSMSRRESSLVPSQAGSIPGVGFSPVPFGRMSAEDFAFESENRMF